MESNEDDIITLTPTMHMRRQPGMYIGCLGDGSGIEDGLYVILKEILNDSVDEARLGFGNQIKVTLEGNHLTVRNFGRGIPFPKVETRVLGIFSPGMYAGSNLCILSLNDNIYSIVCALSSEMTIESYRHGEMKRIKASRGEIIRNENPADTDLSSGVFVSFIPDKDIFGEYKLDVQIVREILNRYAACNPGLQLSLGDEDFCHPDGMLGLLKGQTDAHIQNAIRISDCVYDLAIAPVACGHGMVTSFVDGHPTPKGGTHVDALIEALYEVLKSLSYEEIHQSNISSKFIIYLNIRIESPNYEESTKWTLITDRISEGGIIIKDYFKVVLKENLSLIFREDSDKRQAFLDALTK